MKESRLHKKSNKVVLGVVTFSHLAQHFYAGLSILYPDIMVDLSLNYTQLGIMTGATSIVSGFLQMVWSLLNRYASRRILLGVGNILMSIGSFFMGTANRFMEIVGGNIVSGSGQAAQHPVGTSIITHKFNQERVSGALSIHYGLGYIGNIISPVLLSFISISAGWRKATYILAMIPLAAGLIVLFYLRGEESASKSIKGRERANLWEDIKSAIRIRGAILILVAQGFAGGGTGIGVIITYTPLFLKNSLTLGSFETGIIYSIAVGGGVMGTIVFGYLANNFGHLKICSMVMGTCASLILLLTFYNSFTTLLILHLFIVGATSFACGSLLQAHLASISTPRQRDILLGLYFTIGFGISSVWTTLTGFLIDSFNSFNPAWLLRATLGAVAFSLILLASRQCAQCVA